jgi:orotidine-5'-phosphate decarboxylase
MTREELNQQIRKKKSFLCVGLDPDLDKFPSHLKESASSIFEFNKAIIDAVAPFCVAFKPNTAFYECYGLEGWEQLEKTVQYIREVYPFHFLIADAKRGDIGNTSTRYARTFFQTLDCHAVTVAPYMGSDSVEPFLSFEGRWTVLLALTSNKGAKDFQYHGEESALHIEVIQKARTWGDAHQLMFVAGATRAQDLQAVRRAAGEHYLLVPGIGAQGGSLDDVMRYAALPDGTGVLVNSSRGIIYAGNDEDYAERASEAAHELQQSMASHL